MICSDLSWHKYHEWYFKIVIHNFIPSFLLTIWAVIFYVLLNLVTVLTVCIGNSMICSDLSWHKYHEWYFKIVIHNFIPSFLLTIWAVIFYVLLNLVTVLTVCIGNSMICSDLSWHKYHEWYFKIVIHNFIPSFLLTIWAVIFYMVCSIWWRFSQFEWL